MLDSVHTHTPDAPSNKYNTYHLAWGQLGMSRHMCSHKAVCLGLPPEAGKQPLLECAHPRRHSIWGSIKNELAAQQKAMDKAIRHKNKEDRGNDGFFISTWWENSERLELLSTCEDIVLEFCHWARKLTQWAGVHSVLCVSFAHTYPELRKPSQEFILAVTLFTGRQMKACLQSCCL